MATKSKLKSKSKPKAVATNNVVPIRAKAKPAPMSDIDRFVGLRECAAALGCVPETIHNRIDDGKLGYPPLRKSGKHRGWLRSELEAVLRATAA